jgi:hypothetical protein
MKPRDFTDFHREKITTNDTNTSNNTNKNQFSIREIRLISDIRGKKILCPSCVNSWHVARTGSWLRKRMKGSELN